MPSLNYLGDVLLVVVSARLAILGESKISGCHDSALRRQSKISQSLRKPDPQRPKSQIVVSILFSIIPI